LIQQAKAFEKSKTKSNRTLTGSLRLKREADKPQKDRDGPPSPLAAIFRVGAPL